MNLQAELASSGACVSSGKTSVGILAWMLLYIHYILEQSCMHCVRPVMGDA